MSTDGSTSPRRRRLWPWLVGAALLFGLWFCWQLFGPNPPIVISRETTYITEPLGPDGLPDYEQYVLDLYREGVTPENNAAVLLIQAMGPGYLDEPEYLAVCEELGLTQLPPAGDVIDPLRGMELRRRLWAWMCQKDVQIYGPYDPHSVRWDLAEKVIDRAASYPWTDTDIPLLAEWVSDNESPLNLIVAASRRTECYFPSPSLISGQDIPLWDMTVTSNSIRDAVRALSIRAMLRLGGGQTDDAWHDLMAIFRLGQLIGQGHLLSDQLLAMAVNRTACEGTIAILERESLSYELIVRIQQFLADLKEFSSIADVLDHTERIQALDAVLGVKAHGLHSLNMFFMEEPREPDPHWAVVDWNIVLRNINHWYDAVVAASRLPEWSEQNESFSQIEEKLLSERWAVVSLRQWVVSPLNRRTRSEAMSAILADWLIAGEQLAITAERLANTRLELTRVAAALAAYRAEHGEYPENVEVLVPGVVPAIPVDRYYERPFFYRRDEDGYLLYSVGRNGQDEGGSFYYQDVRIFEGRDLELMDKEEVIELRWEVPTEADDIAIRLPTPPFKLPEPSSP